MKKKIIEKRNILGVCFIVFSIICTTLFGGGGNEIFATSYAPSTLKYSDNNAELVLNPNDQKVWDRDMSSLSDTLATKGYKNIIRTSQTMVYVSEELEDDIQYYVVSDINKKLNFQNIYKGDGGSYHIWQMYQGTQNDEVTGMESNVYFWATSKEKIELEAYAKEEETSSTNKETTTNEDISTKEDNPTKQDDSTKQANSNTLSESKAFAARANFYQIYYIAEGGNVPVSAADTSGNWNEIITALNQDYNNKKADPNYKPTYQIQLFTDLTMPVNWSTSLTGANATPAVPWSLTFTSGLPGADKSTVTLPNKVMFGAAVRMHGDVPDASLMDPSGELGVNLVTPTRVKNATRWEVAARDNFIQANGWSFVVERNVEVTGCASVYGTLLAIPNGDFRGQKKYVNADGNTSTNIEIYSGTWYAVGGVGGHSNVANYYESNVIIGSPEDTPDNHVTIEYTASPVSVTGIDNAWGYICSSRTKDSTLPSWKLLTQGYTDVGVITTIYGFYAGAIIGTAAKPSVNKPWLQIDIAGHTRISKSIIEDTHTVGGTNSYGQNLSIIGGDWFGNGGVALASYTSMIWDITIRDDAVVKSGILTASLNGTVESVGADSSLNVKILDRAIVGGGVYNGGSSDVLRNGSHHLTIKGDPNDAKGVQIGGNVIGALGENLTSDRDNYGGQSPDPMKEVTVDIDHAQIYGSVMGISEGSDGTLDAGRLTKPKVEVNVKNSTVAGNVSAMALRVGDNRAQANESILRVNIDKSTVGSAYVFDRLGAQSNPAKPRAKEMTINVTNSTITSQTFGMENNRSTGGSYNNWFTRVTGEDNKTFVPYYDMATDTLKTGTPRNIMPNASTAAKISVGIMGQSGLNATDNDRAFSWYGEGQSLNTMTIDNVVFDNAAVPVVNLGITDNINQYTAQQRTIVVNISNIKSDANQKINIFGLRGDGLQSTSAIPNITFNLKNCQDIENIITTVNGTKAEGQVPYAGKTVYNMQDVHANYFIANANALLQRFYNAIPSQSTTNTVNINLYDGNVIGDEKVLGDGVTKTGLAFINGIVTSYPGAFDGGTTIGKDSIVNGYFLLNTVGYNSAFEAGKLKMKGGTLKLRNGASPNKAVITLVTAIEATENTGGIYIYKNPGDTNETFPLGVTRSGVVTGTTPLRIGEWSVDDSHTKMNEDILLVFETEANAISDNYTSDLVEPFTVIKSKINPKNIVLGPKSFKITYEPMGATGTPIVKNYSQVWNAATNQYDDPIIPAGEILDLVESGFIPPNDLPPDQVYDFVGWSRDDGGEILANDIKTTTFTLTQNLVLSAHWSPRILGVELKLKTITQESADNKSYQALDGVKFTLYEADGITEIDTITSGIDGIVNFGKLTNGDYILVETQAPTGYRTPLGKWKITVDHNLPNLQEQLKIVQDGTNQVPAVINGHVQSDATIAYLIPVALDKPLPLTGFGGIKWFYIGGGGLIVLAIGGYFVNKKKASKPKKQ